MSITKEQWLEVQQALGNPYGYAELNCDGYRVLLKVTAVGKLKFEILLYVDGFFKGEWLTKDCEERRRFMRPVTLRLYSPKQVSRITKGLTKSAIKKYMPGLDKTITGYKFCWPSFAPLKRHLIANNQAIELVKESSI